MSDKTHPPEDQDHILAAEYVIGLVAQDQRAALARREVTDPAFADQVATWRRHFDPLNEDYGTLIPPQRVKTAIDARLFTTEPAPKGWFVGVGRWLAMIVIVGAALFVGLQFADQGVALRGELVVADSGYSFTIETNRQTTSVTVDLIAGDPVTDATFELWIITDGVPSSLGTFAPSDQIDLPDDVTLEAGSVLAVSIEPLGGSLADQPTGPVIAVGPLG